MNQIQEILNRFREKFGEDSELGKFLTLKYGTNVQHLKVQELIEEFITSELATLIEKQRKEIKKKIFEKINSAGGIGSLKHLEEIINDSLDQVLSLKSLQK